VKDQPKKSPVPEHVLASQELPSLPAVALEVLDLCRRDDVTLDELARAISGDPALAAKLLRYANSSLFNLGCEVTTLQRAALVLGMRSVQLMSLSFSLATSLPRSGKGFAYETFWKQSLALAAAAKLLAAKSEGAREDEAFLAGLLGEIGRLMLARALPDYAALCTQCQRGWPERAQEAERLGYHSGHVGAEVLARWGLPALVYRAVGAFHEPGVLPADAEPELRRLVSTLHVAHHAVELLCELPGSSYRTLLERAEVCLGMPADAVDAWLLELESAFAETSKALELPQPTRRSHAEVLSNARALMLEVGMAASAAASGAPSLAHRDALRAPKTESHPQTGLPTHAAFQAFLDAEFEARQRQQLPQAFGVLLVELDRIAQPREPAAAVEARRLLASVLKRMTRKGDFPAHLEPELFAVLVPECSAFGLRTLAERVRIGVTQQTIAGERNTPRISVSIGGACIARPSRASDKEALLSIARRYLQRAHESGGNTSLVHPTVIEGPAAAA
jgi:diguanylate cyclase (GGDEF)-like protein